MTGIRTKEANRALVWEPKPRGCSIRAGERAILYTSDIGNLETSWLVCPRIGRGNLRETNMRGVSSRGSTQICDESALDQQSGQEHHDSMTKLWTSEI